MPAPPLSLDRIVDEAISLIDAEGPDALTMRRLASQLGTSTMSTYHHVPDKQALIEAIAERVMAELEQPPAGMPWPDAVQLMATSFRSLTHAHPAVFRILLSGQRPVALTRTAEDVVHRFEAVGFSPTDALMTFRTFIRFLIGSAMLESDSALDRRNQDDSFRYGLDALIAGIAALHPAPH